MGFKTELCPLTFHRLVTSLDSTLQGTYQVTVKAQDRPSEGPALEAKIMLNVSVGLCLQLPVPSASPCLLVLHLPPSLPPIALYCGPELPGEAAIFH